MRYKILFYFIFIFLLISCKQEVKKQLPEVPVHPVKDLISPAGTSSSLPHLVSNGHVPLLSWVETKGDTLNTFYFSKLSGGVWQAPERILQGGDWFVNWADYPMISENNGNYWSHVLKKSTEGTYSYDVKMNIKAEGSTEWITDVPLHTDGTPTEHGFVTVVPYNDAFFVTWLDGRNTVENEVGERGAMTLRAAVVGADSEIRQEHELDVRTCDCCQTTAAITSTGPVVLFRDRSEEEIRDISIVRQIDGKWTTPKTIHADGWKIKGCPVNGPKVSAKDNNLVVAWFTAAAQKPKVQVVFSEDAGAQFSAPIEIAAGEVIGRVDVILLNANTAIVSWLESKDKQTTFKAVKVTSGQGKSEPVIIAQMNGSRKSGFPQMELVDNQVHFAWTAITKGTTHIKTAHVALTQF